MALAGPLELGLSNKSIPESAQMLLVGICLLVLAGYGRKRIYKK